MNYKQLYILAVVVILFSSCTKRTPLKQYIHDAEKVEVMIYSGNAPQLQYATNDQDKIQQWMNYISDSTASAGNCSFEGQLTFVIGSDSLPMQFSMKKGCTIVHYTMNGKTFVQPLTDEGIKYIQSLEDRKQMFNN